jgi:hypothetical protein
MSRPPSEKKSALRGHSRFEALTNRSAFRNLIPNNETVIGDDTWSQAAQIGAPRPTIGQFDVNR